MASGELPVIGSVSCKNVGSFVVVRYGTGRHANGALQMEEKVHCFRNKNTTYSAERVVPRCNTAHSVCI